VQPFGGEGLSGTGPKAGGPHYLKAMQQRPRPNKTSHVTISERLLTASEQALIDDAAKRYYENDTRKDRGEILDRIAASLSGEAQEAFTNAKNVYAVKFASPEELPGPTGESNTLRLRARGVVLCLGDEATIAPALAAGNAVIAPQDIASKIQPALKDDAKHLVSGFDFAEGVPETLLVDSRIRAVVFDGDEKHRATLETVLARRKGPIVPVLTSLDEPWRFAAERTLTINTTAAGGDVRLLSLGE